MEIRFEDIPQYHEWRKIEKIHYGWSSDEKFYIENRLSLYNGVKRKIS